MAIDLEAQNNFKQLTQAIKLMGQDISNSVKRSSEESTNKTIKVLEDVKENTKNAIMEEIPGSRLIQSAFNDTADYFRNLNERAKEATEEAKKAAAENEKQFEETRELLEKIGNEQSNETRIWFGELVNAIKEGDVKLAEEIAELTGLNEKQLDILKEQTRLNKISALKDNVTQRITGVQHGPEKKENSMFGSIMALFGLGSLKSLGSKIVGGLGRLVVGALTLLPRLISLPTLILSAAYYFRDDIKKIVNGDLIPDMIQGIKNFFGNIGKGVSGWLSDISLPGFKEIGVNLMDVVGDIIKGLVKFATVAMAGLVYDMDPKDAAKRFDTLWDDTKNAAFDAVKTLFENIVNSIKALPDETMKLFSDLQGFITRKMVDFYNNTIGAIPLMPKMLPDGTLVSSDAYDVYKSNIASDGSDLAKFKALLEDHNNPNGAALIDRLSGKVGSWVSGAKDYVTQGFNRVMDTVHSGPQPIPSAGLARENVLNTRSSLSDPITQLLPGTSVVSEYRDPMVNAAVGGAAHSAHLTGNAVDLKRPGYTPAELAQQIVQSGIPFDKLVLEGDHVHMERALDPNNPKKVMYTKASHTAPSIPTNANQISQLAANGRTSAQGVSGVDLTNTAVPQAAKAQANVNNQPTTLANNNVNVSTNNTSLTIMPNYFARPQQQFFGQ